jgi:hypothetical protein
MFSGAWEAYSAMTGFMAANVSVASFGFAVYIYSGAAARGVLEG